MEPNPTTERHAPYTCPLCEATCGLDITLRGDEILRIRGDKEDPVFAHIALDLAENRALPFRSLEEHKLVTREENLPKALALTEPAFKLDDQDQSPFPNLTTHRLGRFRARLKREMNDQEGAIEELNKLVEKLKQRGVNAPVLDEIRAFTRSFQKA